jgi:PAS domain S-box-containing protein
VQGIITSWSRAAERLYGYTAAEVIGQSIALLAPPERRAELPAMLAQLRRGESVDRWATVRRHKDGRTIDVSVSRAPLLDATGHVIGVASVTHPLARRVHGGGRLFAERPEEGAPELDTSAVLAQERRRLAGALQDTLVQALYGLVLGASAARRLLDRAPGQAAEPIEYVLSLAQAGLAETRALIVDLCPEARATESLVAALSTQTAPLSARHGVAVHTDLCAEPALPFETKEAL